MYMYHSFLIHSQADGHLGCFHVLAIINTLKKEEEEEEETETKLYNQLLLQGLAGIILRLTIVSVQRGTGVIVKVECCAYIPDLSGYVSATLDDMKGQLKVMSDDNLPFWTSVLSWMKGDWWKTIFTIVIVALIVLLCGP